VGPETPPGEGTPPMARVIAPALAAAAEAALQRLDAVTVETLCRDATRAGLAPAPPAPLIWMI
ncbi:hypothetical protein, partial [Elioraea sp. Yellowstone]|uniref:hypothetical protein n=1 Tax=Elioraea sp. Yellowstone TaxID=2592070 RepID=UPI001F377956